jgi:nucleotide-binding universal stress UspA family protein
MYRRILVPTDGSACAMHAVHEAVQLAKRLGSDVTFLYALENPLTTGTATPESLPYSAQLWEDLKQTADEALHEATAAAEALGVTAIAKRVDNQAPVTAILAAAEDHDLVVMGTHGRRGFNRWMFGSVAEGALRRATKPFLLIRASDAQD